MGKNILFVTQSGKLGGAEISLLLLLENINRKIFNPIVIGPAKSDLENKLKDLKIEIIDCNLPRLKSKNPIRLFINLIELIIVVVKIYLVIKSLRISLVHTISNKRSAVYGILAASLAKVPVIWTIRNLQWTGIVDMMLIRLSVKLIAVSDAILELFNQNPKYHQKFLKIYNAVNLMQFNPYLNLKKPLREKWGIDKKDFVVAMVGRLSPEKGHEEFIVAAEKISNNNSNIKFLIIGEQCFYGNNIYYQSLVHQCSSRRLCGNLKFIKFENDIAAVMASIDILVVFSKYESFGRVLVEAMAMEKAVVSSDCGGPREIVQQNKTGIILKNRNVSELIEAIFYLYDNPSIAKNMGREGRNRVKKLFSVYDYIKKHEFLYKEILG